jgi:hypothetical protein
MIMRPLWVILLVVVPTFAAEPQCKGNPKVIDGCYTVHGRLALGADTVRLRLWPVGTKRTLGIAGGPLTNDAEDPIYPASLKFTSDTEAIYGDFEVFPFTHEKPGAMQMVCIESASHVVVKRH